MSERPPGAAGAALTRPDRSLKLVAPTLRDPRVMLAAALSVWTVFGQTFLYFDRNPFQLAVAVVTGCGLDMLLAFLFHRQLLVPISPGRTSSQATGHIPAGRAAPV